MVYGARLTPSQLGITAPIVQVTGELPWSGAQVSEFSGKDQARLCISLDDVQKERMAAVDGHLKSAFNKYKSVLRASNWRDTLKDEGYISAKQRHKDQKILTPCYDMEGQSIQPDCLGKGAQVTAHLQLKYIYAVSGTGGLTWEVSKVRLDSPGDLDAAFV